MPAGLTYGPGELVAIQGSRTCTPTGTDELIELVWLGPAAKVTREPDGA